VTTAGNPQFVDEPERVVTFDLDGTLWAEQPLYTQAQFVLDLFIKRHPRLIDAGPISSLLRGIREGLADIHQSFTTLANLARAPISTDEYITAVRKWLQSAKHPCFDRAYTDLIYQPMRELIAYLKAGRFRIHIISGSGIEFLRGFSEDAFGIPPEQVVGSNLETDFTIDSTGKAVLNLAPWPDFIDNGKRKAESINEFIGRRPIAAFGNSDGNQQMLEWTAAGDGARLMLLVHHTDAIREYEYGPNAHIGHLDLALAEANTHGWDATTNRGWVVVDMAKDWKSIFSFGNVVRNGSASCRPR
jgi:phosphoglycolate phosphatase-like HAD superfamily hydrolase